MSFDTTKRLDFKLVPVAPADFVPKVRTSRIKQGRKREQFLCEVRRGSSEDMMLSSGFDVTDPVRIEWVDYLVMSRTYGAPDVNGVTFRLEKA